MTTRILIDLPSNIGDAIMALPCVDRLYAGFPGPQITAIVSSRIQELFQRDSFIDETIVFDKNWTFWEQLRFTMRLRGRFDVFVDFKNTLMPLVVNAPLSSRLHPGLAARSHTVNKYLNLTRRICPDQTCEKGTIRLSVEEKEKWDAGGIGDAVFFACSSRSHKKQYAKASIKALAVLVARKHQVVILGEEQDRAKHAGCQDVKNVLDLTGQTGIGDIFYLLSRYGRLLVGVDSALMHIASYLDVPAVTIFGPTDEKIFGPWGKKTLVLRKYDRPCDRCAATLCHEPACMDIAPEKIAQAIEQMYESYRV